MITELIAWGLIVHLVMVLVQRVTPEQIATSFIVFMAMAFLHWVVADGDE